MISAADFPKSLLFWVIDNSIGATSLILLLWVVTALWGRRIPVAVRYSMWFLVAVRLVLPFSPPSRLNISSVFHYTEEVVHGSAHEDLAGPTPNAEMEESVAELVFPVGRTTLGIGKRDRLAVVRPEWDSTDDIPAGRITDPKLWAAWIWISGCVLILGYSYRGYCRIRRSLKDLKSESSPEINQLIQETMQNLGISRTFTCLVSPEIKAPAVFGFSKCTLLLPAGELKRMNDVEIRMLLLHELAHIKRRDPMANWITLFVQILHWFNPLVWMALNQFRLEREALCDAMVLNAISPRNHSDYGDLLIRFASSFSRYPITAGTVPIFSNQKQIKRRITMIAHHRPLTKKTICLAALLLIPVISFTFTAQQKTESDVFEIPGAVILTESTVVDSDFNSVLSEKPGTMDNAVIPSHSHRMKMNGVLKLANRAQPIPTPTERSELWQLESVRGGIRSDLILLQSQLRVLKKLEPRDQRQAVRASYSDELLQQLELTEAETDQMIELLKSSFGPKHPEIQAANKSLETVQKQINRRMEGILKGIKFRVDTYKAQIEALDVAIVETRQQNEKSKDSRIIRLERASHTYDKEVRQGAEELQKLRTNFPDIDFDYPETIRFQEKLAQIEDQHAKTLLERSDILNLIHNIESKLDEGISYQSIPHFRNDNVIQKLSTKLSDFSAQLAAAKARYGPKHPKRMSMEYEISDIDKSLKAEINRSIESLRNQAGILEATLERLDETESVLMDRRLLKIKLQTEFDQRKSIHNQKKIQRDRLLEMIQELSMENP